MVLIEKRKGGNGNRTGFGVKLGYGEMFDDRSDGLSGPVPRSASCQLSNSVLVERRVQLHLEIPTDEELARHFGRLVGTISREVKQVRGTSQEKLSF